MPKTARRIARHKDNRADFLLARPEARCPAEPAAFPGDDLRRALSAEFPDLLWGERWQGVFRGRVADMPQFGVLVLRPDGRPGESSAEDGQRWRDIGRAAAAALDNALRPAEGFWGVLEDGLLAAVLPRRAAADVLRLGRRVQKEVRSRGAGTATIGAAGFPALDYAPHDVLENARKALAHAAFFGPNSRVAFDAVSLNISADSLFESGDLKAAAAELRRALAIDPGNANVHNSLGVCLGLLGERAQALAEFSAAAELDGGDYMAVYNVGLVHWLCGDRPAALESLLRASAIKPEVFETHFLLGRLHLEMGRAAEARPFLESAARSRSRAGVVFRHLGECYEALDLAPKALDAYRKAVRHNPADPYALSALGCLFERTGENPEIARVFCRESVRLAPRNPLFHKRLGLLEFNQNRFAESLQALEEAGRLGLDTTEAIGKVRERMGEKNQEENRT
jgi:Flp pilus assembly protein TadD